MARADEARYDNIRLGLIPLDTAGYGGTRAVGAYRRDDAPGDNPSPSPSANPVGDTEHA